MHAHRGCSHCGACAVWLRLCVCVCVCVWSCRVVVWTLSEDTHERTETCDRSTPNNAPFSPVAWLSATLSPIVVTVMHMHVECFTVFGTQLETPPTQTHGTVHNEFFEHPLAHCTSTPA